MDSITIIKLYKDNLLPAEPVTSYLEMDSKTIVPLNFAIGDIRDISKKKGTFSKSIKVPATHNNNIVLNNYYDVNIQASSFDINKLQKCAIIQDGIIILDNAILQLVSIDKNQMNSSYEDNISYTMLIKDSTSDFFTNINNKYLTDINLSEFNHFYNSTNVVNSWNNTTNYKYILPYNGTSTGNVEVTANDSIYELNEMLPAVYAKTYWDRIFGGANYTYQWGTASTSYKTFEKLLIPYNGDAIVSAKEITPEYNVTADRVGLTASMIVAGSNAGAQGRVGPLSWGRGPNNYADVTFPIEINDPANLYTPTAIASYLIPSLPGPTNNVKVKFTLHHKITKSSGSLLPYPISLSPIIALKILLPGNTNTSVATSIGSTILTGGTVVVNNLPSGTQSIIDGDYTTTFTIPMTTIATAVGSVNGAKLFISCEFRGSSTNVFPPASNYTFKWDVTFGSITYDVELDGSIGYNVPFKMNKVIPQKIKQSDYIKGLLTMFNLYVIVDPEIANRLIIISRDDYYDAGVIKDWTKKLVKDKGQELKFLPEISNKKAILTYKADSDLVNTKYLANSNEVYGQVEYIFDNEYVKDITKTELLFSPTPMTNTSFNAVCSVLNGAAPKTNIRVLYDGGTFSCGQYVIRDYITTTNTNSVSLNIYPLTIHWDKPINPTLDLNFLPCDYYYRTDDWGSNTNNNLFNLYWRRTLNQINEGKLLTAYFYLNAYDINRMRLNDRIRIDNSWWNINAIKDYDANSESPTKVELISVDNLLGVPEYITTTISPPTTTSTSTTTTSTTTSTTTTSTTTTSTTTTSTTTTTTATPPACISYEWSVGGITEDTYINCDYVDCDGIGQSINGFYGAIGPGPWNFCAISINGYSVGVLTALGTCGFNPAITLAYAGPSATPQEACNAWYAGGNEVYYFVDDIWVIAYGLYQDINMTLFAPASMYSDGNYSRYWNGSSFIGSPVACV